MATNNPASNDPTNYGTGLGLFYATPTLSLVSGVDNVIDALLCRITTSYLFYEPTYGIDVESMVNVALNANNVGQLVGQIVNEVKKDQRVKSAIDVSSFDGTTLTITIAVTLVEGETFTLVGSPISSLTTDQLLFDVVR